MGSYSELFALKTILFKFPAVNTQHNGLCFWFKQDFSKECVIEKYFIYFSTKTYVVGTQKNGTFEHSKHMLTLSGKKIFTILGSMKKVNKQCLLDTPRTVTVSEKT